jgi:hypothetical protein
MDGCRARHCGVVGSIEVITVVHASLSTRMVLGSVSSDGDLTYRPMTCRVTRGESRAVTIQRVGTVSVSRPERSTVPPSSPVG